MLALKLTNYQVEPPAEYYYNPRGLYDRLYMESNLDAECRMLGWIPGIDYYITDEVVDDDFDFDNQKGWDCLYTRLCERSAFEGDYYKVEYTLADGGEVEQVFFSECEMHTRVSEMLKLPNVIKACVYRLYGSFNPLDADDIKSL